MKKGPVGAREAAEHLAVQALTFIADDPGELGRFLALTGIGPAEIRDAARQPDFLAGVLDHLVSNEALLLAFAKHADLTPEQVVKAQVALSGAAWERDLP